MSRVSAHLTPSRPISLLTHPPVAIQSVHQAIDRVLCRMKEDCLNQRKRAPQKIKRDKSLAVFHFSPPRARRECRAAAGLACTSPLPPPSPQRSAKTAHTRSRSAPLTRTRTLHVHARAHCPPRAVRNRCLQPLPTAVNAPNRAALPQAAQSSVRRTHPDGGTTRESEDSSACRWAGTHEHMHPSWWRAAEQGVRFLSGDRDSLSPGDLSSRANASYAMRHQRAPR
eukprot:1086718-Pleurochrysis_carterae.AAC.2